MAKKDPFPDGVGFAAVASPGRKGHKNLCRVKVNKVFPGPSHGAIGGFCALGREAACDKGRPAPFSAAMAKHIPDIEILGPEDAEKERRIRDRFWPTVKRALRYIPFIEEVAAAYYAMLDPTTPLSARLTLVAALAYFVAPLDFVPDFIFAIGFLDDASVLLAAISAVRNSIKDEHREAARRALAEKSEAAGKAA